VNRFVHSEGHETITRKTGDSVQILGYHWYRGEWLLPLKG
jgi:hypothetical protein